MKSKTTAGSYYRDFRVTESGAAPGSPGLFLKANLEYVRENYRKSIKLLHGCRKGGGPENQLLYLTNPRLRALFLLYM